MLQTVALTRAPVQVTFAEEGQSPRSLRPG
jgi:hypothetical protein